jgi:hypothetical protein
MTRVVRLLLWCALIGAVLVVAIMTWHPWLTPWTGRPR